MELRRVAEVSDRLGDRSRRRIAKLEMEFLREVVDGLAIRLANGGSHLVRDVVGVLANFFVEDDGHDRVANLFEGLGVSRLAVENFDDVKPVLRLDEIGNRTLRDAESGLLKFGDSLALDNPAKVAALGLGSVVFGIFLCKLLEIPALL